jgi:hypothetical protein
MNPRDFFCIPTKPEKIASTVPRVPDLFKASVRNHWGPIWKWSSPQERCQEPLIRISGCL